MRSVLQLFSLKDLRYKLVFTLLAIAVYRLGTHIPISGIDLEALQSLFSQGLLGFVNLFSGGALGRYSIFALGILPYINASIIMQLMTVLWPQLKELAEEGDAGRKQLAQYTKYLALGLAFVQGIVMTVGLRSFISPDVNIAFFMVYSVLSLVAGSALVMWIGEMITEYGMGNGASLIIFVGIIAELPVYIQKTYVWLQGGGNPIGVIILITILIGMIAAIVLVQEAERKVQVQYAKRVVGRKLMGGQNTYIPLRLIQGGVMPIIFASALLQFPLMFVQYFPIPLLTGLFAKYYQYDGLAYNLFFAILIFFFTYFYTAITFNPQELADNIKKYGGFLVGVRPGKPTVFYLEKVINKLTLIGASFLALIALLPVISANITQVTSFMGLGGTAILIIVGVAMDLVKQFKAYLVSKRYEGLIQ